MEAQRNPFDYESGIEATIAEAKLFRPELPEDWKLSGGRLPNIDLKYYSDVSHKIESILQKNGQQHKKSGRVEICALVLEEVGLLPSQQMITDIPDKLSLVSDAVEREKLVDDFLALSGLQQTVYDALHEAYESSEAMSYDKKQEVKQQIPKGLPTFKLIRILESWHNKSAIGTRTARDIETILFVLYQEQNTTSQPALNSVK